MHRLIVFFFFLSQVAYSQNSGIFKSFIPDNDLKPENLVFRYIGYDFSPLWLETPNIFVLGIIGKENQRIRVKLVNVKRSENDPELYNVIGKSSVMGNVCDFTGTMRIKEIREMVGSEGEKEDIKGNRIFVKRSGLLIGEYNFREDPTQNHVGVFSGKFASIWYLDSVGLVKYPQLFSNGSSFNNAFTGTWKSYEGDDERICVWADYDVPLQNSDLNVYTTGFMPARKYHKRGWQSFVKAYQDSDMEAFQEEWREWWK
jgi:hypothetical protein